MTEPLIAAVDGGGTKTLLVLLRPDGTLAGARQAGGSNPFDQPGWRAILHGLLSHLPPTIAAAGIGLAGYGESRTIGAEQRALIADIFACPFSLSNDVDMACAGAFAGQPGVLLLSGTGSMAWASDGAARHARVGGWGSLFGDEGSAYWIGREALNLLTTVLDGRNTTDTPFAIAFAREMGLPEAPEACGAALLEWFGQLDHQRSGIAAQARIVSDLAGRDDPSALRIVREAAHHLTLHIDSARKKLPDLSLPWSYAGGTLQSATLRALISEHCGTPVPPRLPPLGGGLVRAAYRAGWATDDGWIARLNHSLTTILPEILKDNAA